MIIYTPICSIMLWFGIIAMVFTIKYEFVVTTILLIIYNILGIFCLICSSCSEKLYKRQLLLWIICCSFAILIIISCPLLPALKWREATSYNNSERNATGYNLVDHYVPNCYDYAGFPCKIKCRYFISEKEYKDLPHYNGTRCILQPILMCQESSAAIVVPQGTCKASIITCRAMRKSKIAIREILGGSCLAYFSGSKVYWGQPENLIMWPYILFATFSITGFVISLYILIVSYTNC